MRLTEPVPVWRRRRGRVLAIATVGVLLAGTAAAVSMSGAYAATIDTSAWYQIVARHSGKAMGINGASTADGAGLVQLTAGAGTNQQFQFVDSGGGFYRLRARHSGKVIDVEGASVANGAVVRQFTDSNATNQQFQVVDTTNGYVKLVNRNSAKVLDVWARSTADGALVSQYTDNGGTNQQWLLTVVGTGGGTSAPPTTAGPTTPPPTGPTTPPASYPNPNTVSGDTGTHDPSVVKTPSGSYILAATGANLSLKTSTDRRAWRNAGSVFPGGASWTTAYTNGSNQLWAPDISHRNGQYFMYYSASSFGSRHSAIFLATSATGASGSWTNRGLIIETATNSTYNAIDPNLIVDTGGQWWLTFGSFWTGIKQIPLNSSTGLRSGTGVLSVAQRTGGSTAVEAPFVFRHGNFYYLWVSFDSCCQGASSTYRVMVGRSANINGPYTDRNGVAMTSGGGTQVLAAHGSIHGPGHQAVINDNGQEMLFYHYYANNGASFLGINPIGYDSAGWPFVY